MYLYLYGLHHGKKVAEIMIDEFDVRQPMMEICFDALKIEVEKHNVHDLLFSMQRCEGNVNIEKTYYHARNEQIAYKASIDTKKINEGILFNITVNNFDQSAIYILKDLLLNTEDYQKLNEKLCSKIEDIKQYLYITAQFSYKKPISLSDNISYTLTSKFKIKRTIANVTTRSMQDYVRFEEFSDEIKNKIYKYIKNKIKNYNWGSIEDFQVGNNPYAITVQQLFPDYENVSEFLDLYPETENE